VQDIDVTQTLDPTFGLPPPPIDAYYDPVNVRYATFAVLALTFVAVCLATRDAYRSRSLLPLAVTLSGIACVIPEPFIDVVSACFYPLSKDNIAFTILGRQISWLVVAGWSALGAVSSYIGYAVVSRQPAVKWIWAGFFAMGLFDLALEEISLNFSGLYYYYGHQPLVLIHNLPWWFIPCNAGGMFLAVALAYRFRASLTGWKSVAMFFLNPMAVAGMYGFIGIPAFIVVNGNYSWWVTQAGGLLTVAMGIATVALVIRLVLERDPFALKS